MAVTRRAAFEERKGGLVGFQDTVIMLSALEHLQRNPGRAAFVSADKVFRTDNVFELAKQTGVEIEIFESLDDVISKLRPEVPASKAWELDVKEAAAVLEKSTEQLQTMMKEAAHDFQLPPGEVRRVRIFEISNVQTPPTSERKAGLRRQVSFDAHIDLAVYDRTVLYNPDGQPSGGWVEHGRSVLYKVKSEVSVEWDGKRYDGLEDLRIVAPFQVPDSQPIEHQQSPPE